MTLPTYERLEAQIIILRSLLGECQAFLFDDSGTPVAPEDLRERVNDALHAEKNCPQLQEGIVLTVGMVTAALAAVGQIEVPLNSDRRRTFVKMWNAAMNSKPPATQ